jgi:hypothetical protein
LTFSRLHIVPLFLLLIASGCGRQKTSGGDPGYDQVDWAWEEVGPAGPTEELNPGGVAIPGYAENRGNGPGRVNFIRIHPLDSATLFCCSPTGGLFISNDSARTWRNAGTDQLPVSGLAAIDLHPAHPDTWFVATGDGDGTFTYSDGAWRTRDAGRTWENINGGKGGIDTKKFSKDRLWASCIAVAPTNPNRLMFAGSHGLYVSENALAPAHEVKWNRVAKTNFYHITTHPTRPEVILASGEIAMISKDGGATWQNIPLPKNPFAEGFAFQRINFQISAASPDTAYAMICLREDFESKNKGEGSFWKLSLTDYQWTLIRGAQRYGNVIGSRGRAFAVSPTNPQELMFGNIQPIFRSENGGRDFKGIQMKQLHDDIHHIVYTRGGRVVYSASDGGMAISYDRGLTWEKREEGLGVANVFGLAVGQTKEPLVIFGAFDTGGNLLRDGRWYHVSWGDGFEGIINPEDSCTMFITRQNGAVLRSTDCGLEFEKNVSTNKTTTTWHTWIDMHKRMTNMIFLSGLHLMRSKDLGDNWEPVVSTKDLREDAYTISRFYLSDKHPDVMYLYIILNENAHCLFYRTYNISVPEPDRVRWEPLPEPPVRTFPKGLAVDPAEADKCWIVYDHWEPRGKIFRFDGMKYNDIGRGLEECSIGSLILERGRDKRLYIGTTCGVFTRSRHEKRWTRLGRLPGCQINSLAINYTTRQLYIGTFGRGVWKADLYRGQL